MEERGHYHEIAAAQLQPDDEEEQEHPSHMERVQDRHHVAAAQVGAQNEEHHEPFGK
jgi:hypothetical protein